MTTCNSFYERQFDIIVHIAKADFYDYIPI